jgi:solute carrier family 7 (L-type amino acid transporter), member 6
MRATIGLAEYTFFLLSVVGLLLLRRNERRGLGRAANTTSYSTWIGNPLIFSTVATLLIVRGVMTDPLQGVAILIVTLLGLAVFYFRFGSRGFTTIPMT